MISKLSHHRDLKNKVTAILTAYTGLENSQLDELPALRREEIFSSLWKQFELAISLHGREAQNTLRLALNNFVANTSSLDDLIYSVNSLLVYGDVRSLKNTAVEFLHERLAHFWRILGWEELNFTGEQHTKSKHKVGNIDLIMEACGNLVRILDLLAEQWDETGSGINLIYPVQDQRIKKEEKNGYRSSILLTDYTNTLTALTGRNEVFPTEENRKDFREKGMLLDRLLCRYPLEIAYVIFDYFAFSQKWEEQAYNISILQEYIKNGERRIKGIISGKAIVLQGTTVNSGANVAQRIIAMSNNKTVTGSSRNTDFSIFDQPMDKDNLITLINGGLATIINSYPDIILTFNTPQKDIRKKIMQFSSAIKIAKQEKPILTLHLGSIQEEYHDTSIDAMALLKAAQNIEAFIHENDVKIIHIEAGHLHADTFPSRRQRKSIEIGAFLYRHMQEIGLNVAKSTMIDEDHVPNVLNHKEYIDLMRSLRFDLDEVIYESSPVIREIAVSVIASIMEKYPGHLTYNGNALILNIPKTELYVELIKDIEKEPFELGCVVFDIGLTLYKIYPELDKVYGFSDGKTIHKNMYKVYEETMDLHIRNERVRKLFPYRSSRFLDVKNAMPLLDLMNKQAAILNVLENFYSPQQQKLKAMLQTLSVPILLIDVVFSKRGLELVLFD